MYFGYVAILMAREGAVYSAALAYILIKKNAGYIVAGAVTSSVYPNLKPYQMSFRFYCPEWNARGGGTPNVLCSTSASIMLFDESLIQRVAAMGAHLFGRILSHPQP